MLRAGGSSASLPPFPGSPSSCLESSAQQPLHLTSGPALLCTVPGSTPFCRQETEAHCLGHLLRVTELVNGVVARFPKSMLFLSTPSGSSTVPTCDIPLSQVPEAMVPALQKGTSMGGGGCVVSEGSSHLSSASLGVSVPPGWEEKGKCWMWIYLPKEMSGRSRNSHLQTCFSPS